MNKLKEFMQRHEEFVKIVGNASAMIGVGIVCYICGSTITTLKVGAGLSKLHELNEVHLVDADGDRMIEDLREFHSIVKYAKEK